MIVAGFLAKLFKDMTLTYDEYKPNFVDKTPITKPVQYHFGDSKELAKWIRGRSGKQKYPLIWCVIEPRNNSAIDTIKSTYCLYLFTSTNASYYNNTRSLINYSNIIDPLTDKIYKLLESNPVISLAFKDYESIFTTLDIPNYGLDFDDSDFTKTTAKGAKSITIDIVDARKIEFQGRFTKTNINCLT